jgi:hypothetical protein
MPHNGVFSAMLSMIDFSSLMLALLAVMAGLAGLLVIMFGGDLILSKLKGPARISYGGRMWDEDVYRNALSDLEARRRRGEILDRESYSALRRWKSGR